MKNKKFRRLIFLSIICILIILFLLCLKSCSETKEKQNEQELTSQIEKEKQETLNLIQLFDLLERADFCSQGWNEDALKVVDTLKLMAEDKSASKNLNNQEIGKQLQQVSNDLGNLIEKNSIENIDALEESLSRLNELVIGEPYE